MPALEGGPPHLLQYKTHFVVVNIEDTRRPKFQLDHFCSAKLVILLVLEHDATHYSLSAWFRRSLPEASA